MKLCLQEKIWARKWVSKKEAMTLCLIPPPEDWQLPVCFQTAQNFLWGQKKIPCEIFSRLLRAKHTTDTKPRFLKKKSRTKWIQKLLLQKKDPATSNYSNSYIILTPPPPNLPLSSTFGLDMNQLLTQVHKWPHKGQDFHIWYEHLEVWTAFTKALALKTKSESGNCPKHPKAN